MSKKLEFYARLKELLSERLQSLTISEVGIETHIYGINLYDDLSIIESGIVNIDVLADKLISSLKEIPIVEFGKFNVEFEDKETDEGKFEVKIVFELT